MNERIFAQQSDNKDDCILRTASEDKEKIEENVKLLFIYINPTGRSAMPPNVSMLIGYLKGKSKHNVEVFDTTCYKFDLGRPVVESSWTTGYFLPIDKKLAFTERSTDMKEDLSNKIKEFSPDLIAISCYSNQYAIVSDILGHVKKVSPGTLSIVGGCHTSFMPEHVISNKHIDIICLGEGEEALLELCNKIDGKEDIRHIENLWVKDNGKVIRNLLRKPVDLDKIGTPCWEAFDPLHLYQPFHGGYFRTGMVEFGRGCPFKCTYCANKSYLDLYKDFGRSYFRHRKPEKFIEMLKKLKTNYKLELIYFQDGTFLTMPDEVLIELADLYRREINLPCIILTTVTTITEKRLESLRKMSCIYINLGIEAGNPVFREKVLNRKMSDETIINAFELVRKNRIYTAAYNVIGFPYETREDIMQTIELNIKCRPDSIYTQIFYPIDGCELTKVCLEHGFLDSSDETLYSQICDIGRVSILKDLPLDRAEIHALLRTFYLYVKMPKELYPMISLLVEDIPMTRKIISNLTEYYWKQEPHFKDTKDLIFRKKARANEI